MTSATPQPRPAGERGTLLQLAARVRHLCPDRRDPGRFHVEKDEIERERWRCIETEARCLTPTAISSSGSSWVTRPDKGVGT